MTTVYDFTVNDIKGSEVPLEKFRNKVLLIVNTASKCGFTPQYKGLEDLHQELKGKGFEVLGFPCNQFGGQEPGSDSEIASFCDLTFKTTFPMFSKIDVNGKDAHPLYNFLTEAQPGILGTKAVKWNFTKFLIDKDGNPIKRFAPNYEPESIRADI